MKPHIIIVNNTVSTTTWLEVIKTDAVYVNGISDYEYDCMTMTWKQTPSAQNYASTTAPEAIPHIHVHCNISKTNICTKLNILRQSPSVDSKTSTNERFERRL